MCLAFAVLTVVVQACLISATDVCSQQAKSDPTPNCNAIHLPGLHEIVPGGKPYTIRWDNNTGSSVSLVLCQGPSTDIQEIGCIVDHAPNNGLFVWTPATNLVPDGNHNYGLKIIANTGDFQWSDQFGISNSITSSSSTTAAASTQSKTTVKESVTSIKGTAHSVKQASDGQIQEPTGTVETKKKNSSITIKTYTTGGSKTSMATLSIGYVSRKNALETRKENLKSTFETLSQFERRRFPDIPKPRGKKDEEGEMSALEKLPREIRDHIYENCLLFDGEIDPFPDKPLWEHPEYPWTHERLVFGDFSTGAHPIENKPCVALLGVNSKIRDEAASTLFGKNTWRLSSGTFAHGQHCLWETWWEKYAQYFRHLVTSFDFQDADQAELLDVTMGQMERTSEDSDHFDPAGTADIHQPQLNLMKDGFIAKKNILLQMELKTLSIDLRYLFCPSQCCRREAIQTLLIHLGSTGPWYRLEQERGRERDTKPRTDVKLLGLKNDEEEKLFWDTWGYKAD